MNTYDVNELKYTVCLTQLKELKAFHDYKIENDEKKPLEKYGNWRAVSGAFEVAIELLSAKLEKREAVSYTTAELLAVEGTFSALLNFSYACDFMSRGYVTFGRCPNRKRRLYEHSFEEVLELIKEEIYRIAALNREKEKQDE